MSLRGDNWTKGRIRSSAHRNPTSAGNVAVFKISQNHDFYKQKSYQNPDYYPEESIMWEESCLIFLKIQNIFQNSFKIRKKKIPLKIPKSLFQKVRHLKKKSDKMQISAFTKLPNSWMSKTSLQKQTNCSTTSRCEHSCAFVALPLFCAQSFHDI